MKIECSSCGHDISIAQEYQFHSGFSNRAFLYCDSCPAILEFNTYNPGYTSIVGDKHPWTLNPEEKRFVEDGLKPCTYGCAGRFRFGAPPRCPLCNEPLLDLLKDEFHFIEIGKVIDGDQEDVWL